MSSITSVSVVASVSTEVTNSALKDPSSPTKNMVLAVRSHNPPTSSRQEGIFYPLTGKFPVIVQGSRQPGTGSITFLVSTQADFDKFEALLEPARTLYLQIAQDSVTGMHSSLFIRVVGELVIQRLVQALRAQRDVTFSYVEVAAP